MWRVETGGGGLSIVPLLLDGFTLVPSAKTSSYFATSKKINSEDQQPNDTRQSR
jgi:hypothetical protein